MFALPTDDLPPGSPLGGVAVPGSKSVANRALLLAALAKGRSVLHGLPDGDDTRVLREALGACGIPIEGDHIQGALPSPAGPLWLGASGTSLRFVLPWLALH